jgi:hypothetical protein
MLVCDRARQRCNVKIPVPIEVKRICRVKTGMTECTMLHNAAVMMKIGQWMGLMKERKKEVTNGEMEIEMARSELSRRDHGMESMTTTCAALS